MTESKTKILYLITKSNFGGAQRYVYDLATHLDPEEFDIAVALGGEGELKEKLESAGIRVIPIPSLQRDLSIKKEMQAFVDIYKILKLEQPDVFHINSSKAGGLGAFIGRLCRVPNIIFTSHAWAFNEDRPSWQKPVLKLFHWLTVLLSHRTITVSNAVKDQMDWPMVHNKMFTVYNGRPTIDFLDKNDARVALAKLAPQLADHIDGIWTGSIGELHPVKRHDVMIEVVANLVAGGHQIRHLIIGDGELQEKLTQLIEEKGLTEHVFLLGRIDEAARYLKAFNYYVQPSRSEALAYTVVEAAQAGLPIVASNVGGIPEVIENGKSGLLVPKEDPTSLQSALERLLNKPDESSLFAQAAQERGTRFSMETMQQETLTVYVNKSRTL